MNFDPSDMIMLTPTSDFAGAHALLHVFLPNIVSPLVVVYWKWKLLLHQHLVLWWNLESGKWKLLHIINLKIVVLRLRISCMWFWFGYTTYWIFRVMKIYQISKQWVNYWINHEFCHVCKFAINFYNTSISLVPFLFLYEQKKLILLCEYTNKFFWGKKLYSFSIFELLKIY